MTSTHKNTTIWKRAETGDWAQDNKLGRSFATSLIERMQVLDNPTMLSHHVKAMQAEGKYGGFEVGFFQEIAERLTA